MTPVALKDWLKQWLEVVKAHQAQHLEKRHGREVDAFERQMRLKDERLESFRRQLLSMESEFNKMKSDLEELKSHLAMAVEEKSKAERAIEVKDKELRALLKTMLQQNGETSPAPDAMDLDQLIHHDAQQRVLIFLQKELNDAKYVFPVFSLSEFSPSKSVHDADNPRIIVLTVSELLRLQEKTRGGRS